MKKEKIESVKNEFQNIKNYKSNDHSYVAFKNIRVNILNRSEPLEDGTVQTTTYSTINMAAAGGLSLKQVKDVVDALYNKFENIRENKDFNFSINSQFSLEDIKKVVTDVETILD